MGNKVLFLDRDGVINRDTGYVHEPEKFVFVDGVVEFCLLAQRRGYAIVVVTNQSGVARGYYTEAEMNACNAFMVDRLAAAGVTVADVFCCTSSDDAHPDRKPNPGLFMKARDKWAIDMASSVSVGDSPRDIAAGEAAGVGRNLLFTGSFEELKEAL